MPSLYYPPTDGNCNAAHARGELTAFHRPAALAVAPHEARVLRPAGEGKNEPLTHLSRAGSGLHHGRFRTATGPPRGCTKPHKPYPGTHRSSRNSGRQTARMHVLRASTEPPQSLLRAASGPLRAVVLPAPRQQQSGTSDMTADGSGDAHPVRATRVCMLYGIRQHMGCPARSSGPPPATRFCLDFPREPAENGLPVQAERSTIA